MKKRFYQTIVCLFAFSMLTVGASAACKSPVASGNGPLWSRMATYTCANVFDLIRSNQQLKPSCGTNPSTPNNGNTQNKPTCGTTQAKPPACNKPTPTPPETNKPTPPETSKPTPPETSKPTPPETDKPTPPVTKPENPGDNTNTSGLSAYESQVVTLVNAERAKSGLAPLKANAELSKVARLKSQDMKDKNYFDHTSPTYGSPFDMMKKFGISYRTAGENIAYGQSSPEAVVKAWMNSEGHRKNIMNTAYTEIGVGYVSSGHYWTQMFIG